MSFTDLNANNLTSRHHSRRGNALRTQGFAEEIAVRDFVALNVTQYRESEFVHRLVGWRI